MNFVTNLPVTGVYIGGVSALLVFFGILFSILRFAMREYNRAKDKGLNPYIPAMWGAMAGFGVGIFVVTMWFFLLRLIGFSPEFYVCVFFTGRPEYCLMRYGEGLFLPVLP